MAPNGCSWWFGLAGAFAFVTSVTLPSVLAPDEISPPRIIHLVGEMFHVQGVDVDADFIYVTSVDKQGHRGYLHKFTRAGRLVASVDLTEGARFHPGGIALDGESLWVPLAEYKADSSTRILELDKTTLAPKSSFVVRDHIGAVTAGNLLHPVDP